MKNANEKSKNASKFEYAFVSRDEADASPWAMLINDMIESDHVIRLFVLYSKPS